MLKKEKNLQTKSSKSFIKMKRSGEGKEKSVKKSRTDITEITIQTLETSVLSSPKNYNDILQLLDISKHETNKPSIRHSAAASLLKVFGKLAKQGLFKRNDTSAAATEQVTVWLNARYTDFKQSLYSNLNGSSGPTNSPSLAVSSLTILLKVFSVVDHKYLSNSNEYYYPKSIYSDIISNILFSKLPSSVVDSVLNEFINNCLQKYDDLRYYFYNELAAILTNELQNEKQQPAFNGVPKKIVSQRVISTLQAITKFPSDDEAITEFFLTKPTLSKTAVKTGNTPLKLSSHRIAFQNAWIASLQLPQTTNQYKEILNILHQRIIPNMQKPHLLMDFLTDCYNYGGSIALLALNGLFLLMQKYNLDYPNFFTKLYTLFDGTLLHAKYRSRFFRLVDLFLSSSHLPSAICASFIKKMARLSLTAPPAAIVATIPFIYNQLKRHPNCMRMIHNTETATDYRDPFDNTQLDPLLTNAIDSSLWELETLQSHYHPNVSALARIMSQPFRKPQYVLEDFLDHSYKTLFEAEKIRKVKATLPALEYETFDSVFESASATTTYMPGWTLV